MASPNSRPALVWGAAIIDVALIVLFVLIGRRSHDEAFSVIGLLTTLWPFAVGLVVGWLIARAWRAPLGIVVPGLILWASTVVLGMLLRLVSGQGVEWAFVVVATIVTGVFLLGWRAIALLTITVRRRAATPAQRP